MSEAPNHVARPLVPINPKFLNPPGRPQPNPTPINISRPIGNSISSVNPTPSLGFGFFVPRSPLDSAPGFNSVGAGSQVVVRSKFDNFKNRKFGVGAYGPRSPFDARPGMYTHLQNYSNSQLYPAYAYGFPYDYGYGAGPYDVAAGMQPTVMEPEMVNGLLTVESNPRDAMVFVDTVYVGAADDLFANGVPIAPGRHWLEVDAPNYDKNLTEIIVSPGQPLRYRVSLTPVRNAAAAPRPGPPQTMYAIPGCYGGNRPPVASSLPPGCDIAKVRVIRPPQRQN